MICAVYGGGGWECTENWEWNLISMKYFAWEGWTRHKIDEATYTTLTTFLEKEISCYEVEGWYEL